MSPIQEGFRTVFWDKGADISTIEKTKRILRSKLKIAKFISQYFAKKAAFLWRLNFPKVNKSYTSNFAAVHLKMDRWNFIARFSHEAVLFSVAIVVAGLNLWYFSISGYHDSSLALSWLQKHTNVNTQLVLHSTAIKTSVVSPTFFNQAFAENFPDPVATSEQAVFEDNVMVKPNPDSVQELVSRQVNVYTTVAGDTLSSIATKFNVSVNNIKWSNNLPSDIIRPGWFLIIPPTDSIAVKLTDPNTTFPDLAKKYSVTTEEIVITNGRANAEDIPDLGAYIIIKNGHPKAAPAPTKKSIASKLGLGAKEKLQAIAGGHIFPKGYCTWYVATKVKVTWGGNANRWPANAKAQGYLVDKNPVAGSIIETGESRVGHVAYVEKVSGDSIYISEMNYKGFGIKSTRVINKSIIRNVIHVD